MPFSAVIDRPAACISAYSPATEVYGTPLRGWFQTDAVRSVLNEIRIGRVTYPLRHPCTTDYIPVLGDFLVEGFSPTFVGHGATPDEAQQNWALAVHAAFQDLQHKRPFEMTSDETEIWSTLVSGIDVTVYRNQTPIQIRQFGKIGRTRPYPEQILWEDGSADTIALAQVDSVDFITYKSGQPLEAVVARDPVTFQLLRILYIHRRSTDTRLPAQEEAELLNAIGSAKALPSADWA